MKHTSFLLLIAGISGAVFGWVIQGVLGSGGVPTETSTRSTIRNSAFRLSEPDLKALPATKRLPRDWKHLNGSDTSATGLAEKAVRILEAPELTFSLSARIELAETLAALAKVDPQSAITLAARLPAGDISASILDHLAHALIASHGSKAPEIVVESANSARRHELLQHLMAALAQSDPESAFEMGREHQLFRDARGLHLLFLTWGESDPLAAANALATLPMASQRKESSIALAAAWTRTDPESAFQWMDRLVPSSLRESCQNAALEQLALSDPASALKFAMQAPLFQSVGFLSTVFATWSGTDPSAATAAAFSLPEGRIRDEALAILGNAVARRDPSLAAELLSSIPPGPQAQALAASMAADWAEIDAPATLRWIESLSESLRERALESSLARLANNSPELAAEFAEKATATPALADQIGFIAAAMAAKDPEAALQWAERFESDTSATQIRQATLLAWSAKDPVAAMTAATALESPDRDSLISQVASSWAQADPGATLEWARNLEGDLGIATRGKALEVLATRSPELARAELEHLFNAAKGDPVLSNPIPHSTHPLTESTAAVVRELAAHDPKTATEWARALPEGSIRREILSRHYTDWAAVDPTSAVQYAESNLQGWDRDWTLVSAVFRQTESASTYPDALALAPRIHDPAERARAVRLIRNSMVAPSDWRQQLMKHGFTREEIDQAGE